ncbi:MAG: SH3 domain-containing protein [Anaerolineae bacterium]|nr:MAG: SH3 domain-containing protein [Anaerolineae bacterium]
MKVKFISLLLVLLSLVCNVEGTKTIEAQGKLIAKVGHAQVNVRDYPSTRAGKVIAVLTLNTEVEILGREELLDNGDIWVYVRQSSLTLEGWILGRLLIYPDDKEVLDINVPVLLADTPTPTSPLITSGFVIAEKQDDRGYARYGLYLREMPSLDAPILERLQSEYVQVYGRLEQPAYEVEQSNHYYWVYVSVIGSDLRGWVYDEGLRYPVGFDRTALPILPAVTDPNSFIPSLEAVTSLLGTTNKHADLRYYPSFSYGKVFLELETGTPVTVLGRSFLGYWLWIEVNGQRGWITRGSILVTGDIYRLPIMSPRHWSIGY